MDGYLEIFSFKTYFPHKPLKLKVVPTSTSLSPTSNGDLIHLRKMFTMTTLQYTITISPEGIQSGKSHKESVTYARIYNNKLIRIRLEPINPE